MEIPAVYLGFNILPYMTVQDIQPESRRRAFLQQVQAYYNDKRVFADNINKDHCPYFRELRELDTHKICTFCKLPHRLEEANEEQKDEWIQDIILQRKVMLKAFRDAHWEQESESNADKASEKEMKENSVIEELKTKSFRERREDVDYENRKELIYAANRAVWKFRREMRFKATNKKVSKV